MATSSYTFIKGDVWKKKRVVAFYDHAIGTAGAACPNGRRIGENNPRSKRDDLDGTVGTSTLLLNNNYQVDCDCGYIYEWEYYAKTNDGVVHLQVWRETGGSFTLVGENIVTVTAAMVNDEHTENIPIGQRIQVQDNDYLGIYNPGNPIIPNDNEWWGRDFKETESVGNIGVGNQFDWGSIGTMTDRTYALNARITSGSDPTFTNLAGASVRIMDTASSGDYLFTVAVADVDGETLTTTMTPEAYFDFDTTLLDVTVKTNGVPSGSYILNFRTTDLCGNTATGTLTVVVTNSQPFITSLPARCYIHEDTTAEILQHSIAITDNSPTDTIVCTETDPKFQSKLTPASVYGIYSRATPGFVYNTKKKYTIPVTCTDSAGDFDSSFLVCYIFPNIPPTFTNLPGSVSIPVTTASGVNVFQVTTDDFEGDAITFSSTCSVAVCPFTLNANTGDVVTNTNLDPLTTVAYDILVSISDGLSTVGPRSLTIIITGINTPPFIQNLPLTFTLSVLETIGRNNPIYQIRSADPDKTTQTLTYSAIFTPTEGATIFDVDPVTGLLHTSSSVQIDYEALTAKTFTVDISVNDGSATDTQSVSVSVADVNEAPTLGSGVYYLVGNEGNAGTVVGDPGLTTTDPDTGDIITYSIDCQDFVINPITGVISFAIDFDLDIGNKVTSLSCLVSASDGDLVATSTLIITINGINDNIPSFGADYYTFTTSIYANVGDVIGTMTATDGDLGIYGSMSFSIGQIGLPDTYFAVTGTGDVYVTKSLSPLGRGSSLTFSANVTDYGGLTDTAWVTVLIYPTTTLPATTTTERYVKYIEDPLNVASLIVFGMCGLGATILIGYLIFNNGVLSVCCEAVQAECCNKKPKRFHGKSKTNLGQRMKKRQTKITVHEQGRHGTKVTRL
ncbi:protocadherin Fat 4-like [Argopecten irradians]|uniref:protocadherin Fat 4-like n=1 Tax=Argopecten irradians TaxID=31199 RepID=UPI003711C02F